MTAATALKAITSVITHEVTPTRLNIIIAIVAIVVTWLLAQRSHTREDRAQVLTTLRAVRRYQAPCEYAEIEDALYAFTDALVPFGPLQDHGRLLTTLTMTAWRESQQHWELNDGDPASGAGGTRSDLRKALRDLTAAISLRVRRPRRRQGWGARRELQRIKTIAGPAEELN